MSSAARVTPRPAAPASSTAPRAPASPVAKPVSISAETLARIEAVLVVERGETVAEFVRKAVMHELGCREGARSFRKALGMDATPNARGPVKAGCSNGCTSTCAHAADPPEESFS